MERLELNQLANLVSQLNGTVEALQIKVDALQTTVNSMTKKITLGTVEAESFSFENLNGRNLNYTDEGVVLTASEIKLDGKMHRKNKLKNTKEEK